MIEHTQPFSSPIDPVRDLSSPAIDLQALANHLPDKLPFSGVIVFQRGNERIVEKAHSPQQTEFSTDQPFNFSQLASSSLQLP